MSLYRKYRPQNFANLVGQEHVRITLTNALKTGNVHHAYLFTGPRGTGKTSTARLLAKAINCLNLQGSEPCENCEICQDITDGRLIDLIEIDAASNRGIDEIRDLREKIVFAPTRARSKVYIIDEVHMLTKEAFNALLKTLEEPPTHVYFILATTEVHKIPETILSRCQRFDFKRIDERILLDRLGFIAGEEKIIAEEEALKMIARSSQGGLRDAIGLLEQLAVDGRLTGEHVREILGISGKMSIETLFGFLQSGDAKSGLREVQNLYGEGYDLIHFNKDFLEFLRGKLLESVYADGVQAGTRQTSAQNAQGTAWILKLIDFFQESYESLKYTTIAQLPLEIAIIQACGLVDGADGADDARAGEVANDNVRSHKTLQPIPVEKVLPAEKKSLHEGASQADGRQVQSSQVLGYDDLKAKWSKIPQQMKVAAARRLFSACKLEALRGHEIHITFQNHFSLEKMMETANRNDFEEALAVIFGAHLKIVAKIEKIDLAPEQIGQDVMAGSEKQPSDAASKLMEVFGGELIQE